MSYRKCVHGSPTHKNQDLGFSNIYVKMLNFKSGKITSLSYFFTGSIILAKIMIGYNEKLDLKKNMSTIWDTRIESLGIKCFVVVKLT